jgi:hypothetical protein
MSRLHEEPAMTGLLETAFVRGLVDAWARFRERLAGAAELDSIDAVEVDRIARDLSLPRSVLRGLAARGSDAADRLRCRLAANGLSRNDFHGGDAAVLRDLERSCAVCDEKRRCGRDLARSAHEARWPDYCLNAATLVAWQVTPRRLENGK